MQKIPFRAGEGPYTMTHPSPNAETNQVENQEILYNVRAYGAAESKQPSVFILSESSWNQQGDIASVAPRIAAQLCQEFGFDGFDPRVIFLLHYPENVKGNNNPETFLKAEFEYHGSSPRLNHLSAEISQDKVAQLIGQENMEPGYQARSWQNQNPLVQKAFDSGLDR